MHLKSLTLRGFKSFAAATTLHFEPGITCVVGPNGSGKSNVVDALAWVLGEQGAKSLRGGKMEDVVFAGTLARPPLGRAEVVLVIDNSDGTLPIDYTEVTLARTLFRNGGSEYAINGQSCRLLDVQELLSDSGIGREMHVVVGQGQLDAILHATPEERRGFIEEAAGVLKYRKRKEKALRKLAATDANLSRLQDLIAELRRQLKPLGRQAEIARRAASVQAEARDARARILADDVLQARAALAQDLVDEAALRARRSDVEVASAVARRNEADLEEQLRAGTGEADMAQEGWYELSGLRERIRGTAGLAAERVRLSVVGSEEVPHVRDPQELEVEADRLSRHEAQTRAEAAARRGALDQAVAAREAAELAYAVEDRRANDLVRRAADHREWLARLGGQVTVAGSQVRAVEEELERLHLVRTDALARAARADHAFTALETGVAGLDAGEHGLDAEYEGAQSALHDIEDRLAKHLDEAQRYERERAGLAARREALELSLGPRDAAAALLAAPTLHRGLLGSTAALLTVQPGYEAAVAAALGEGADAVAVSDCESAMVMIDYLKAEELGRVNVLLADGPPTEEPWPLLPDEVRYVIDVVHAPASLRAALRTSLTRIAVVADLREARLLVAKVPSVVAVTRDGDVVGAHRAAGGSPAAPSVLESRVAYEEAGLALAAATHSGDRLRFEVSRLEQERAETQRRADVALARLHESDAAMAAVAEELGQLRSSARSARDEAERVTQAIAEAQVVLSRHESSLTELQQRMPEAVDTSEPELDTSPREQLAVAATLARDAETEARLGLRTAEERARALAGQADSLRRAASAERETRSAALARRERLRREGEIASAVAEAAALALQRIEESLALAHEHRLGIEVRRREAQAHLDSVRFDLRTLAAELERLTDSVHRDEVARAEQRLRLEQLEQRAGDELGLDVEALVNEYGPDLVEPPGSARASGSTASDAIDTTVPFDRSQQLARLQTAERTLAQLGQINPLALEEFTASEERHAFLSQQLDDLRRTRRDLMRIVSDVDARVEDVLTTAWADTAREFHDVFVRLFPGGEGRLVLTDPTNMLTTGVDVEARPAGKKVKRLSLLSGGERSLVAVAFLVALFKARPSPFYILDEVEAALDDTNLSRLLDIYDELRATSQLVVITHQKRTMEIADALYGVSMRGDGVSAVISQRLRDSQLA